MNDKSKPPEHGFEIEEFEVRIDRAQKEIKKNRLDALLVTTQHNFRYFTGFDSNFWESPTRPWFLIIPSSHEPIAVIPSIGESALKQTWINNIHVWESPNPADEGVSLLAKTINNISNKFGAIGSEIGKENSMRMPNKDYINLQKQTNKFSFVDGSSILWNLRMIKSKEEVKRLKHICKITSDAYEYLPKLIHLGESERSICNKLKIDLINRGVDQSIFMACASGQSGYEQIIFNPTEKILKNNDILFIDTGSTYDGYFCDFDRNYGFGKIDDNIKKAYEILYSVVTKGIDVAKPGKKCSDIFTTMNKILEQAGSNSRSIGRMGHGFGLQLTEPPSNMLNDHTLLKTGMAITIEPVFEFESGKMLVQEEDLIITEDGNEVITTRSPKEIPLIK